MAVSGWSRGVAGRGGGGGGGSLVPGWPLGELLRHLADALSPATLWRFPYVCYVNGGGAFLVSYLVLTGLVGVPLVLLEQAVGQFAAAGPVSVFNAVPLFQGLGVGIAAVSWELLYYPAVISWAIFYLLSSFLPSLPWTGCQHSYNSHSCYSLQEAAQCRAVSGVWFNNTCFNQTYIKEFEDDITKCGVISDANSSRGHQGDIRCSYVITNVMEDTLQAENGWRRTMAAEEFFNLRVMGRSEDMEGSLHLRWELCLTYLLAWGLCYLSLVRAKRNCNQALLLSAGVPYLLLVILGGWALTLPGTSDGLLLYLVPKWDTLLRPKVWMDAAGQLCLSLMLGSGALITRSSYSKFHNNFYRQTFLLVFTNTAVSVLLGLVPFAILGFVSSQLEVDVRDLAQSGSGLIFLAYPALFAQLPISQLWSIFFFTMFIFIGVSCLRNVFDKVQSAVVEAAPRLKHRKVTISCVISFVFFSLGLLHCTSSGVYWTELWVYFGGGLALIVSCLLELIIFTWFYSPSALVDNMGQMLGFDLRCHWILWMAGIAPVSLLVILVWNCIQFEPLMYGANTLPDWAQALGWAVAVVNVLFILLTAVVKMTRALLDKDQGHDTLRQRLGALLVPGRQWEANSLLHAALEAESELSAGDRTSHDWPYIIPGHRIGGDVVSVNDNDEDDIPEEETDQTVLVTKV